MAGQALSPLESLPSVHPAQTACTMSPTSGHHSTRRAALAFCHASAVRFPRAPGTLRGSLVEWFPLAAASCAGRRRPATPRPSVGFVASTGFNCGQGRAPRTNRGSLACGFGPAEERWAPPVVGAPQTTMRAREMQSESLPVRIVPRDEHRPPAMRTTAIESIGIRRSGSALLKRAASRMPPMALSLVRPTTGVKLRGPEGAQRLRATSASMSEL
jgi:hypothetical protein